MGAETTVYAALANDAAVDALIDGRISPNAIKEKTPLPAICYTRADTEFITTIHSSIPVGEFAVMEVWCMAKTEDVASSVADAAIVALGGAKIPPVGRRHEYDSETEVTAVVITVRI
jgi:hypothetical protein